MGDMDRNGRGNFFRMFRRKKKRKKEFLLSCLKQLSLTTEEQTTIIRALTEQSNQHSQDMKHLQDTLLTITTEVQRLNDKNANLLDKLKTTESHLIETEKELVTGKDREQELEDTNMELSTALRVSDKNFSHLQMQEAIYQERLKSVDEQNETLNTSVVDLKAALDETKSKHAKLEVNVKILEMDLQHRKEIAELEKKIRLDAERRLNAIRKTLDNVRIHEYTVQLGLDAENECLKFDVRTLTKRVKKMKEALNNMRRDKLLLMSYYIRQQKEKVGVSGKTQQYLAIDTADGSLVPVNEGLEDEVHPDILENITLKNKLMSLESRIYRKEQLIDELVRIIEEHDPHFNVEDQPCFKVYLDVAQLNVAKKQMDHSDIHEQQVDDNYSSTVSSDNLDEYF